MCIIVCVCVESCNLKQKIVKVIEVDEIKNMQILVKNSLCCEIFFTAFWNYGRDYWIMSAHHFCVYLWHFGRIKICHVNGTTVLLVSKYYCNTSSLCILFIVEIVGWLIWKANLLNKITK